MSEPNVSSEVAETVVPIKVPQPDEGAPPSLAQPASGPAAEMHGALHGDAPKSADTKTTEETSALNGTADTANTADTAGANTDKVEKEPVASEETAPEEKPTATDADTEMKDVTSADPAPAAESATDANGASVAKSKRKSSAGVPEHRTKSLKKKQSKQKITNLDAKPGEYYLARLRSYPPWPSIICDEAMLPDVLLNTRPVTAMLADGTWKEPYADGGKKVADRSFPVMFLHTNEFGWIPNTDLTPLEPEQCKDVPEKGKSKTLIEAYKVAAEDHDIQHFKNLLMEHDAFLQKEEEARQQKETEKAEKAATAEKKKRKSEVKVDDDDVEMEDAAETAPKKSSKKRKKDVESDEEGPEKPAKTPKTTKLKLTTGKTPSTDKKTDKKTPKAKSDKKKKAQDSEEEQEMEKEEVAPVDPVQARKDREKEVLFLRHKLQKGFLSRDQEPAEDEMPQMATYIKKLEAYGDTLEVSIIRQTRVNKVLKGILKLNTIPKDEEYHFRERSVKLLGAWNQLLGAEPADAEKSGAKDDKASPLKTTSNGTHKEAEEKAEEKIEDKVEEPAGNTVSADEAANKISADVPGDAGDKAAAIEEIQKDENLAEEAKTTTPAAPAVEDKAPASAEGAAVAQDVVKANE